MGKRFEQILHQRRSVNGVPFVLVHKKMLSVVTIRETPQLHHEVPLHSVGWRD